jgi:hypothetical protein
MKKDITVNFRVTEEEKKLFKKLAHRREPDLTSLLKKYLFEECKKENLSIEDLKTK